MWHSRFLGTWVAVLVLLGFMEGAPLAAYPAPPEFSMNQPQETQGLEGSFQEGSFQVAVMGGSAIPLDIPVEKSSETIQPEKPAVEKPKATRKVSKPKKKKVKKAQVQKAPAKEPVEEEEGFLSKTFRQLVGSDDEEKEATSKPQLQKTAGTEPEKEEEGLLTRTLKTLVGDDKKEDQSSKKDVLNPINMAPTGSATQKKEVQPKTAKSETKQTLKDSFEKLIGVGAVNDDGGSPSAKTDTPAGETKSAKKEESGGLLDGILGGSETKKDVSAKQQAKAQDTVEKTSAPAKPRKFTARKYPGDEGEGRSDKNYGGAQKGKNVLKESFKTLVTDDKKKEDEE